MADALKQASGKVIYCYLSGPILVWYISYKGSTFQLIELKDFFFQYQSFEIVEP